jgi:2-C-methyl-D-erythritol 2,4-cyclodiphosphate synthase
VRELVCTDGWQIGNIDVTVIAQAPKLAPHILSMRNNLAQVLQIDLDRVSIKATTEEKLGFTGEKLGISTHAVCLLYKI